MDDAPVTRRASLVRLGGLLAGATAVAGWRAVEEPGAGPAAVVSGAVRCVLAPEQTAGPYQLDDHVLRSDIREAKPGVPLTLRLGVVDVSTCRAIRGALVDVWHCDAAGTYSGVQGDDGSFLRGLQRTSSKGVATFRTIYPGWYPGRTVHVHVQVSLGGDVLHTGQLYFPDSLTDTVYRRAPYSRRPGRSPRNPGDSIYRNGGKRSTLALMRSGSGYVGSISMGVMRG